MMLVTESDQDTNSSDASSMKNLSSSGIAIFFRKMTIYCILVGPYETSPLFNRLPPSANHFCP